MFYGYYAVFPTILLDLGMSETVIGLLNLPVTAISTLILHLMERHAVRFPWDLCVATLLCILGALVFLVMKDVLWAGYLGHLLILTGVFVLSVREIVDRVVLTLTERYAQVACVTIPLDMACA